MCSLMSLLLHLYNYHYILHLFTCSWILHINTSYRQVRNFHKQHQLPLNWVNNYPIMLNRLNSNFYISNFFRIKNQIYKGYVHEKSKIFLFFLTFTYYSIWLLRQICQNSISSISKLVKVVSMILKPQIKFHHRIIYLLLNLPK